MAKKEKVNKTKAVKEHLKNNPGAGNRAVAEALGRQGITISPAYVAGIKTMMKKKRLGKNVALSPAAPATASMALTLAQPAKPGDTISLDQIKKVALTIKAIGGIDRLRELLEVVRETGGMKKFRDLLEAMSVAEAGQLQQ
jgi:hypothetical protein